MATFDVVVGFVGVALGTVATSGLTIYKERFTARREREAREAQRQRDREDQRNVFQRDSLLALQQAVSDLVQSVYDEQDRMLVEMETSGRWPARTWETVTAAGWSDAERRLEMLAARVFDDSIASLAARVRTTSRTAVWAPTIDGAKTANVALVELVREFNDKVRSVLPGLYVP